MIRCCAPLGDGWASGCSGLLIEKVYPQIHHRDCKEGLTAVTSKRKLPPLDLSEPALLNRGIAQPGSASALGAEGRRFESCCPDQF